MTEIDKINALLEANTQVFGEDDMYCIGSDISQDFDFYYGWNEADVAISTYADDYQIVTNHVIDMQEMVRWKDLDGEEHDGEVGEYNDYYDTLNPEQQDRYDNGWTEVYEYYIKSTDEGAYQQYWFNVKTGACFVRDRLLHHPQKGEYHNVEGTWTPLRAIEPNEATDEAYYMVDFGVHPELEERGYEGYSAYEYDEQSNIENRIPMWLDLMKNPQLSNVFKYGGLEMLSLVNGEEMEQWVTAVKIASRHHYVPENKQMWRDYIQDLIRLQKDLHNPFYVCPEDLREAHEKFHRIYLKNLEKIRARQEEEMRRKKLLEMQQDIEAYAQRIIPFLTLAWHTDQYAVFVCPSVEDMVEEGVKMHHCVGSMGYDKKPDSLILFCRTPNGERISTIEYSISQGKVLQNRAACNKVPLYMDEVNKMLEADADKIRKCKVINIKQKQPMAMAA